MSVEELLRQYLPTVKVMQLATSVNDQPWACTVHFFADEDFNLYWLSLPTRRHSEDIKQNSKVAAAIVVHEDTPTENYLIGLSIEGTAQYLGEKPGDIAEAGYAKKHGVSDAFMHEVTSGNNPHKFYKLSPKTIVLFDNKNFPDDPRKVWKLKNA